MAKFWCLLLLALLSTAVLSTAALATPSDVEKIIERQRQQGFDSPSAAIRQLEAVRNDAGPGAPLALRVRYHNALASLYIGAEDAPRVEAELKQLERMATAEQCAPCRHYQLIREAQWALRRHDTPAAQSALTKIDELPVPTDRDIVQSLEYVRGVVNETTGEHDRAIEHGIRATELALATGNAAEQVRSLNLLLLSNIGRRDLVRAESLANEAYALAERIGFTYMMAYVRGNQAWIHSLKVEPEKQLQALTDALRIARSQPGMADAELINLVNLAEYHGTRKDFRQAADLAAEAVRVADQQHKPTAKAVAMMTLGNAQVELGQIESGMATMQQSIALLESLGAKGYLIDSLNVLADVQEKLGLNREALATLRKATVLKEAAITEERDKVVTATQVKFSAERKDHEIERLSLENARREAEVSART